MFVILIHKDPSLSFSHYSYYSMKADKKLTLNNIPIEKT
ncbi:hypothetical protein HMPREF9243_0957 [Aerococcus sp. Group 1]|nr:hypothetical protein HMPREF9243_0957 [Aerococcus sp. Group 1]